MRVGLNATCFDDRPSGANQRFRHLYGALIRRNPAISFVIYEPADQRIGDWFADAPNIIVRRTPMPSSGRWPRFRAGLGYWRRTLAADRLDLFETFTLPLVRAPCPTMLTIHDLRPLQRDRPLIERAVAPAIVSHALARADRIITVSQAMRAELLAFRPGTQVSVVYNGVSARAAASGALPPGMPSRFMLAVGHLEPRKNLELAIDAVAVLRDRGCARPLVIVGNDAGSLAALQARIARLALGALVWIIEHADDATVGALYAACHMVVVPSRYEGFGIAVIEAMAAERPVVTSDTAVFREVSEGQGAYMPLDDAVAAAEVIERVWSDPIARERLIGYGARRIGDFAFDRLADQIAALYAERMAARPRRATAGAWNRS
ncbi:glycosyltransferase family 4 protein [Sphingomonas sp. S1-29]|uniref:glycosyltransferase family 4 protein n=1 Tax=Sphingomonas sp. S1-29 TaxID=2991074 RepID=UPI00223FE046|nr:glycosyltransferase family 1 protein [Sphingomonas sp. S1-29]UZK69014.1 glycosyltransferase family 4 protein [Sphingomonas sp. S1-29]